ncbi:MULTISPECIES: winged helix-turn-helix domain-containing protein [unclassified Halomonas]
MSYKKAWQLIDTMNRHFPSPLITTAAGGAEGGGAQVTPLGRQVLDHYRALQRRLDRDVCEHADALLKLMRPDALAAED